MKNFFKDIKSFALMHVDFVRNIKSVEKMSFNKISLIIFIFYGGLIIASLFSGSWIRVVDVIISAYLVFLLFALIAENQLLRQEMNESYYQAGIVSADLTELMQLDEEKRADLMNKLKQDSFYKGYEGVDVPSLRKRLDELKEYL